MKNRISNIKKLLKISQEQDEEQRYWYRSGDPDEFSEFTFDPTGKGGSARMSGGRGSGFSSGQYAFSEPGEGRVKVPVPSNALRIGWSENAVHDFQEAAISMMRFAEIYDEEGKLDPFDSRGYGGQSPRLTSLKMALVAPARLGSIDSRQADVIQAIKDWGKHKQVHPVTLLLSRWGFNGIEWVGPSSWAGSSGDYGNVTFPPIDEEGAVQGLESVNRTHMKRKASSNRVDLDTRAPFFKQNYDYGEMDFISRIKERLKRIKKRKKKIKQAQRIIMLSKETVK